MNKPDKLVLLLCLMGLLLTGCVSHRSRPVAVVVPNGAVVSEAPPPPRTEARGTAPSPEYVWVDGYWANSGTRWVWVPGHWERGRPGAMWVAGHWDRTSRGWVWIPGRWETAVGGAE